MSVNRMLRNICIALLLGSAIFPGLSWAVGQEQIVATKHQQGDFALVQRKDAAPLYVDSNDYPGVIRAAHDLSHDIQNVTGIAPAVLLRQPDSQQSAVIVATLGKSALLNQLIRDRKIDTAALAGKWESYLIQTVAHPFPGVSSALVIAGSDKRGTIYGIYELSEQIGVSPWYWWADVPVPHQDALSSKPGRQFRASRP